MYGKEDIMSKNIAIDGPAGAGKSTIAKRCAKKLGYIYVDTGAMYRAMAIHFVDKGTDVTDENAVKAECENVTILIKYEGEEQQVILNGVNVTGRLRQEEVGKMASKTSVYKCVRTKLVELQKELASKENVIMDGRDIGTCVLPNADLKIYLTASVEKRAKRRYDELVAKGETPSLNELKKDIENRDYQDMHRQESPLKQADDAILVDTSDMGIEEVTDKIINLFNDCTKTK